jgi:hypothetical protein
MSHAKLFFGLGAIAVTACTISSPTPASGPAPASTVYVDRPAPAPVVIERPRPTPPIVVTPPSPPRVIVQRPPVVVQQPAPSANAWERLGDLSVSGKYDRDVLTVGRHEGKFEQLMIRVKNSRLRMYDLVVVFANGTRYHPNVDFSFRAGETQSFDLPGERRTIKQIEFRYRDLPGGGQARVEIWGR